MRHLLLCATVVVLGMAGQASAQAPAKPGKTPAGPDKLTILKKPELFMPTIKVAPHMAVVVVKNQGNAASKKCYLTLEVFNRTTGAFLGSFHHTVNPLAPGAVQPINLNTGALSLMPNRRLIFTVDSDHVNPEWNEANNVAVRLN